MNYFRYMKSVSKWHFFKEKTDKDFTFDRNTKLPKDFNIDILKSKALNWKWADVENLDTSEDLGPLEKGLNTKLVAESIADRENYVIKRLNIKGVDWLDTLAKDLNLQYYNFRFLSQEPNKNTVIHVDSFYGKTSSKEKAFSLKRSGLKPKRYILMLTDWDFGQVMFFGNSTWTHWLAGDLVCFEATKIPHGSANSGWSERSSIVITGFENTKV